MPPTTISEPPNLQSFTSIADHQSQTPSTFYDAKPVLHFHSKDIRAVLSRQDAKKLPVLEASSTEAVNGDSGNDEQQIEEVVEVFVSSENLILFNPKISKGISIPYPTVSLHAVQTLQDPADNSQQIRGLYMQLDISDPEAQSSNDDDDVLPPIELTLLPPNSTPVQSLFDAVSNCSNLHPDPVSQDDEMEEGEGRVRFEGNVGYEGLSGLPNAQQAPSNTSLPPPMPGSGGWITSENLDEFFDEEGNFIGGANMGSGPLGPGSGRTRANAEVNGTEDKDDDSKRVRTE